MVGGMGRIDPRKLETFRVVAQARKVSTAAKLLHLSQPAVTAQVRALEEECGRTLLLRSSRGVTPTDWGLRLLEAAKDVQGLLESLETDMRGEPAVEEEVVVGASMNSAAYVLPPLSGGQLERIVPVRQVTDLTIAKRSLERELAMVKVRGRGDNRKMKRATG